MRKTLMLAVYSTTPDTENKAKMLASDLKLPFVTQAASAYSYLLIVTPNYIGIKKQAARSQAIYVDFLTKPWKTRLHQLSIKKEALARALGLKKHIPVSIVDATGGLGRDSFILASLGFQVTLLERSPIIYSLLKDGIKRAALDPKIHDITQRLHLVETNAITWLKAHEKPDIIYLDPMFPERKKSALPKKEMLIFHDIVGDDTDANDLLNTALACATKRVVVKRPKLSDSLKAYSAPSFSLIGSSCRFDIYLK